MVRLLQLKRSTILNAVFYSIDREIYILKHCHVKFHHTKSKIELLRVSLSAKSRCQIHFDKDGEEWAERCWVQWNTNLERSKTRLRSFDFDYDSDGSENNFPQTGMHPFIHSLSTTIRWIRNICR